MSRPAVLLDRDGVLNVVIRGEYVRNVSQFQWLPGAREAIGRLTEAGWPVVVVTNQSGISRGFFSAADLEDVHQAMRRDVEPFGGHIAGFYYCPHQDHEACECRKPLPGLLHQAAEDLDLDLSHSFFIGDTETDMRAGRAAGCRVLAVKSGLSSTEEIARWSPAPERIFPTILDAVEWLNAVPSPTARI